MMKQTVRFLVCLSITLAILTRSAGRADDQFESIFNGKDLNGWDGNPALWSVRDGTITGVTTKADPIKLNQFLIWRDGTVEDFELKLKLRMVGNNNSGIQYRSRELENAGKWVAGGYQCDVHPNPPFCAMLYEERGRGIVAKRGSHIRIGADGKKEEVAKLDPPERVDLGQWNEFHIIARGCRLEHRLNGTVTVIVEDLQENRRSLKGIIAFQLHRGAPMEVQIKDVRLKRVGNRVKDDG